MKTQSPMGQLFRYVANMKGLFAYAVFSSISNKVLDLMPPILVGWVIATVSGDAPNWIRALTGTSNAWDIAIFLAILGILVFGFESLTQWMMSMGFMSLSQHAQHRLRLATYNQMQSREMAFFERHRLGETLAMLNDDVNQLERFLNDGLNQIIQVCTLCVFAGIVLFTSSWQLALIGLSPLPFILVGAWWFKRQISPRYKKVRESVGAMANRIENNISGIMVIKSFGTEKFESHRLEKASEEYRDTNIHAIQLSALFVPLIRMFVALGFAGVLLVGSYWVLSGDLYGMTVAKLVVFSMMIQRVLWPMTRLGEVFDEYERAKASARRIFGLLHTESDIRDPKKPESVAGNVGLVEFDHVAFDYDENQRVVKDMNFTIQPGETIGVVGQTGAGKSTIIKLLLRLYDVSGGAVRVNGHDVRQLRLKDLRRQIALVSQDVYLFHGTIFENIAYGSPGATKSQVIEAAKMAQLHDFITSLNAGYESIVGERGIKLSGGQRQRLSIARAVLKGSPILVLDEATSAVDTETERLIQESIRVISKDKTAIIIAHRLSTIRDADRILVLQDGAVVEEGHHDELVALGGTYAELWRVQSGGVAH